MKATIEFTLPEEQEEYEIYNNARNYYAQLWDIDQYCRSVVKYGVDANLSVSEVAEKVREMIRDLYN